MKRKNVKIFLYAAFVCIVTGLQLSAVKYSIEMTGSTAVFLWWRFLFGTVAAALYAAKRKIPLLRDKRVILLSFLHPFLAFYMQSLALERAEVYVVSVITAFSPAVTTLMAFVSGEERLSAKEWFAVTGIISGGLVCAFQKGTSGSFLTTGSILMALAIVLRGVYYVSAHKMTGRIAPEELSLAQISWSFLFYSVLLLLGGSGGEGFMLPDMKSFYACAYMGIVSTAAAFFANNYVLKHLPVSLSASLGAVTFIINLISASLINGEEISGGVIIGSGVMIIFIVILARLKGGERG